MYISTTGLVLRETPYMESSRILTVLTADEGKITVVVRGAKRRGSRTAGASQLFAYSDMTLLYEKNRYILTEASPIELFDGLRRDIAPMALASYFVQLLENFSDEDTPDPQMLSLGLNALYVLSQGKRSLSIIKSVFEMRLMCLSGFTPETEYCPVCGKSVVDAPVFSITGGAVHCAGCRLEGAGREISLFSGTLDALKYIVTAEPRKLYAFSVGEDTQRQLAEVSQAYLLYHLGHDFAALDYYNSVKDC